MGFLFNQPAPQQAVPGDLADFRRGLIGLLGSGGNTGILSQLAHGGYGSTLQQQSGTGIMQYLNQAAPEQQALNTAMPALQQILSGPGAGVLDPLKASFQQNLGDQLSQLNASTPGRFSSANLYQQGLTRERSLNDFNTLGANILQQGVQNQLGAANTLGALSGQAGQAPFNRLATAQQLGQGQSGMNLQALMSLLGLAGGPAFGGPFTQAASPFQNILGLISSIAGLKNPKNAQNQGSSGYYGQTGDPGGTATSGFNPNRTPSWGGFSQGGGFQGFGGSPSVLYGQGG
jgi:hypothetical protein